MHNVLIISYIAFSIGNLFILPESQCRPGWFSLQSRITYKKITMANGKSGRPKAKDPKTHRYNFKLNDEQELHFRKMLEEAGYRENISKFILARLFG